MPDLRADILKTRGLRLRNAHAYPTAYLALGCTHHTLTVPVSMPSNVTGHSSLVLWGPEAAGDVTHWLVLGGLWTFVAFHGALGLVGFRLRLVDIALRIRLWTCNALAFCTSMAGMVLCSFLWSGGDLPLHPLLPRLPQLDAKPIPHDGRGRCTWRCIVVSDPWRAGLVAEDVGCILHFCMRVGLGAGL